MGKYDVKKLKRYTEHELAHDVLFSASTATLRKLAKRKDKIGRAARQVLAWEKKGKEQTTKPQKRGIFEVDSWW